MVQQGLFHSQSQAMKQEQVIAPHQIQSLEMLTAHVLEMQSLITQELEINPTLERIDNNGEQLIGDPVEDLSAPSAGKDDDIAGLAAEKDEFLANLMQLDESWRDSLSQEHAKSFASNSDSDKRKYFFDSLTTEQTLSEHLMEQLRTSAADERMRELCELIIGSISESGYLRTHLADLSIICNGTMDELDEALALIQTFDPPGVGARDVRESLLIQLKRQGREDTLTYKVVDKFLDKMGKNRIVEIGKALKVSPASLYDVIYEIRQLQPRPGNAIESSQEHYVLPEIFIEKDENNNFKVKSNKDYIPKLRISSRYLKLLEDPATTAEVRNYVKEKINSGTLLIKSISQRQSTIQKISECILRHQTNFFVDGEEAMKPLTMSLVAEEIGVHETTVSRAIANKYVQTNRGMFPLKHFFTSGFKSDTGDSLSSISIRKKIKAMISEEDPSHPVSDKKIVDMLKDQGLSVARRTVAKYREAMGVPSSHMRKNYR